MSLTRLTTNYVSDTGQISAIVPTNVGSGYTSATVTISGGNGSGATADAIIQNGFIIGYTITDYGTNYSLTSTPDISDIPTVSISGDGSGAAAIVLLGNHIVSATGSGGDISLAVDHTQTMMALTSAFATIFNAKMTSLQDNLDGHLTTIEGKLDTLNSTLNSQLSTHNSTLDEIKTDIDTIRSLGDVNGVGFRNRGTRLTEAMIWQSVVRDGLILDDSNGKTDDNIAPSLTRIQSYIDAYDDAFN